MVLPQAVHLQPLASLFGVETTVLAQQSRRYFSLPGCRGFLWWVALVVGWSLGRVGSAVALPHVGALPRSPPPVVAVGPPGQSGALLPSFDSPRRVWWFTAFQQDCFFGMPDIRWSTFQPFLVVCFASGSDGSFFMFLCCGALLLPPVSSSRTHQTGGGTTSRRWGIRRRAKGPTSNASCTST